MSEGIVLDYDEHDRLVGIDIDHARHKTDLTRLVLDTRTAGIERSAA